MNIFWSHRQLPELSVYNKKQKDILWKQCTEKYGIGTPKYVFIGFVLPAILTFLIYLIIFMFVFPVVSHGYFRIIGAAFLGGILGLLSSAVRISILRPYLQQMINEQQESAEQDAAANP